MMPFLWLFTLIILLIFGKKILFHFAQLSMLNRWLIITLFCIPFTLGMRIFLRVCYIWKTNPEKYLDSPMSSDFGFILSAIFALPSLAIIIVLLLTPKSHPSPNNAIMDNQSKSDFYD